MRNQSFRPTRPAGVDEIGAPLVQPARLLVREWVHSAYVVLQLLKLLGDLLSIGGGEGRVVDGFIGNGSKQLAIALKLRPHVRRFDVPPDSR